MRRALAALLAAACLPAAPAAGQILPTPPTTGDPVIAAAGDIACDPDSEYFNSGLGDAERCRQLATSDLLVDAGLAAVLPLGDTQYEDALLRKYMQSYEPSWGRVLEITRPVIGNHEYFARDESGETEEPSRAAGYFDYFNGPGNFAGRAGDRDKGYYSYDVGDWHLVALNSVCSQIGGCGPGSPQERWLRQDLARNPRSCTLAYFHHAYFTASGRGWTSMETIWQVLHDAGVDVVLSGHMHQYERFAPMNAAGAVDPAYGIRSFVVGSGGKNLGSITAPRAGTEAWDTSSFGVLKMTLRPTSYEWRFQPAAGDTYTDSGSSACHEAPPERPPVAATGTAGGVAGGEATLHGAVEPSSQPATFHFEYGPDETYGFRTPEAGVGTAPDVRQAVYARVGGLRPGQTYHYRVVVTNASGTFTGADRTFVAGRGSRYANLVGGTPGLLAHWRFGETRGNVAFDDRGRFPGTYDAAYRLARRGATAGERDGAVSFGAPFSSMRAFGPVVFRDATIEGWFRWTGGPVLLRDDSSQGGWYIAREAGGRLTYRIAGETYRTERAATTVRDGAWHHIAVTKSGPLVDLYVDGRLVHSGDGAPDAPATMPWHVMRNGPFEQHASGTADEIAMYDRALSPGTIARHYRTGVGRGVPETRILLSPRKISNDTAPLVAFGSTEKRSQLRCALGRAGTVAAARPCRSPMRLPARTDGRYRFEVYAVDRHGYPDPTPRRRYFTIDTVAPNLLVGPLAPRTPRELAEQGMPVDLSCTESCTGRGRLILDGRSSRRLKLSKGRPMEIGRAQLRLAANGARRLRIRVTGEARKGLRRLRAPRVTLRVAATDAAGNVRGFRGLVPISQ